MLNTSKLIGFLATKSPDQARVFYEATLGLALVSEDQFAMVFDANGTMLRIHKVEQVSPPGHTVLGWEVNDIATEVAELAKRGVKVLRYDWMKQDEQGIWTAPGGARVAWFKDPDGNTLSLTQFS
jgi:predicted enzyme related to lactoylglutathione lyase